MFSKTVFRIAQSTFWMYSVIAIFNSSIVCTVIVRCTETFWSPCINSYWFQDLQNSRVTGDNPLHSPMNYTVLCSLQFLHIWITGYWLLIKVYLGVQNKCFPFYSNYGVDTDSSWFQTDDDRPHMTQTVWHYYLWTTGITMFWSSSCNVHDTRLPWPVIILPDLNPQLFCTEISQS